MLTIWDMVRMHGWVKEDQTTVGGSERVDRSSYLDFSWKIDTLDMDGMTLTSFLTGFVELTYTPPKEL